MFSTTRQLYFPLRRFKPKAKIPVLITKDHIPSIGRPYFAGEKRRVKKGVMRYLLYPNKVAVYATKENEAKFEEYWKNNPHYEHYLKEKKTLYSLECYLKTKNLVVSEPITRSLIQRYLDYCINLRVPYTSISIKPGKTTSRDSEVRNISVHFEPVGYVMKFKAIFSSSLGVPFNQFAYDKLNLKAKDPNLAAIVEAEMKAKLTSNVDEDEDTMTEKKKDQKKKSQFTNEWMQDRTTKISKEEMRKESKTKKTHLLRLREERLKRAGGTIEQTA